MQVAIRLRRKSSNYDVVFARFQVVVDDLADKVARFGFAHGCGSCRFSKGRYCTRTCLSAGHFAYNIAPSHCSSNFSKMPKITLPDGSERQYDNAVSGAEIAASIGEGLARAAVAVRVDGSLWDLTRSIEADSEVALLTRDSDDGLELLRHDAAHVLAEAVKELWPSTQVTIGPAIENGFYYDFAREEPFTEADLETIENRMKEIVARDESIEREVWERDKAIEFFKSIGEAYKAQQLVASSPIPRLLCSPAIQTMASSCCATMRRTCLPRLLKSSGPVPRLRSARRLKMAFITTLLVKNPSLRPILRPLRTA